LNIKQPVRQLPNSPLPSAIRQLERRVWCVNACALMLLAAHLAAKAFTRWSIPDWLGWSGVLLYFGLVFSFAYRYHRIFRIAVRRAGCLCPVCLYPIPGQAAEGVCPECGTPFNMADCRSQWSRLIDRPNLAQVLGFSPAPNRSPRRPFPPADEL